MEEAGARRVLWDQSQHRFRTWTSGSGWAVDEGRPGVAAGVYARRKEEAYRRRKRQHELQKHKKYQHETRRFDDVNSRPTKTPLNSMDHWDEFSLALEKWDELWSSSTNEDAISACRATTSEPDDDSSSIFSDEPRTKRSAADDDAISISDDDTFSAFYDDLESLGAHPEAYARLKDAVRELEEKVFKELTKRGNALLDLGSAFQKVTASALERTKRSAADDYAIRISDDDGFSAFYDDLESLGAHPEAYARLKDAVRELQEKVFEELTKRGNALLDLGSALQKVTASALERTKGSAADDDASSISDDDGFSAFHDDLESLGAHPEVYARLKDDVRELEEKVFKELTKSGNGLLDLGSALQKVKELEELYHEQIRQQKSVEHTLVRQTREMEEMKTHCETLSDKLHNAEERMVMLEQHITKMNSALRQHQQKLATSNSLLESLKSKNEKLQHARDAAVTAAEELRQKSEERISTPAEALSTDFSLSELQQATRGFHEELKIGEGKFGCVYKGSLRNTTVAIKLLEKSFRVQSKFNLEVAFVNRVRHPNVVMLMGSCREAPILVYEFLPNGSLEDRLACNNAPPLTWQERTRIIAEMCSVLTFFHSNKPHPVVHGDLKPANVLLDASLVSKLAGLSMCDRGLIQSAYMDPEFMSTGELTPRSDVYSWGLIILQLLTGRPPQNIAKVVKDAIMQGKLHSIIDPSSGSWPFVDAEKLAQLGLRCADMRRTRRPDLGRDVWVVVASLMKAASRLLTTRPLSFEDDDDDSSTPSYFFCPISKAVMSDPCIAADGYTYEAKAIRRWILDGGPRSPMTNDKLEHCELTPNRALLSAILEWQQQQQQQQQRT